MNLEEQLNLIKRGIVHLVSEEELIEKLKTNKPLRIKLGVDPTSRDLHLGHSVVLNKLRQFQELGHIAVLIIGDFTAQVGDPSGRDTTRPVLDYNSVVENAKTYTEQAFKILDKNKTEIRFNSEWLGPLMSYSRENLSPFINIAKNITISRLLEREDFKNRMKEESPISLLEIFYPIFQGYDSVAVNADVEMGGQDQIFNLLVGRDIQKLYNQKPQVVITMPLLVGTDGVKKMSKSVGNYIAFNDNPDDIFGKIMSISDDIMFSYYELLTQENIDEIKKLHPMEAKKKLGEMMVKKFWTEEDAIKARKNFEKVFSNKEIPDEMKEFIMKEPMKISQIMVSAGIAKSGNEARRLINSGAVRINSEKLLEDKIIQPQEIVLQSGKRNFLKIKRG